MSKRLDQSHYEIGPYSFEMVRSFQYLISIINNNLEEEEVKKSIAGGNRDYFSISRQTSLSAVTPIYALQDPYKICNLIGWRNMCLFK